MQNKQTTVKQQEKRQTSEGGNSKNQNIANSA
jgi:hypothetical protein